MSSLYDPSLDVLSVPIGPPDRPVARSIALPDAVLQLDEAGLLVRCDLLKASTRYPTEWLRRRSGTTRRRTVRPAKVTPRPGH
jgi:hypothetical protein